MSKKSLLGLCAVMALGIALAGSAWAGFGTSVLKSAEKTTSSAVKSSSKTDFSITCTASPLVKGCVDSVKSGLRWKSKCVIYDSVIANYNSLPKRATLTGQYYKSECSATEIAQRARARGNDYYKPCDCN